MNNQLKLASLLTLGLCFAPAGAVTIYECIDEAGDRMFRQSCPPGTTQASEKQVYTGSRENAGEVDMAQLSEDHPITFYTSNNCEACEIMRVYLVARDVPFSQKNVADDAALQEELIQASGELAVPYITIGEQSISGYDMAQLRSTLDSVGYPDKSEGDKSEGDKTEE